MEAVADMSTNMCKGTSSNGSAGVPIAPGVTADEVAITSLRVCLILLPTSIRSRVWL